MTMRMVVVRRRNGARGTLIPIRRAAMIIPAMVILLPISTRPTEVRSQSVISLPPVVS